MDHFGYDVAHSQDWHSPTWYDARKFDEWFGTLRGNRRAKEIMPLLHVVSSDDKDRTDRDPHGDGQGGGSQSSPSGQEGRDAGQSDNPGPSQDDQNNGTSNGGQGGNINANENSGSTKTAGSLLRLAQDNALFQKLGFNKFYLLPHTILVKGAGNVIFGSYDKKFPFLSQSKYVPINPLIHVSHVTQGDFK